MIHLDERLYYYSVKVHKHGAAFKQRFIKHFQASGRYGTGAITQIFFTSLSNSILCLLGRLYSTQNQNPGSGDSS